jgi:hypothetical protein
MDIPEDWELESRRHEFKMELFPSKDKLPAKIIVISKKKEDDNQVNKRTFRGVAEEGVQSGSHNSTDDDQRGPQY